MWLSRRRGFSCVKTEQQNKVYLPFLSVSLSSPSDDSNGADFQKGQVPAPTGRFMTALRRSCVAVAEAEAGGRSAGVAAGQLFVVVQGTVTFVLIEIAGKSEEVVKISSLKR